MGEKKYCYEYPHAALTADCVVFGFDGRELNLLLVERGIEPYKGLWALPGGFMKIDETVEECAIRELGEETSVKDIYLQQFHVFSEVERDPRERVVTVAFYALVRKNQLSPLAGDDAAQARWFRLDELPPLAFDHYEIVSMGLESLRENLRTRPIAFRLLDKEFTMTELQRVYEAINGVEYDRRNFSRKMISTGYLSDLGPAPEPAHNRVPQLYSFDEEAYMADELAEIESSTDEIGTSPHEDVAPAVYPRIAPAYTKRYRTGAGVPLPGRPCSSPQETSSLDALSDNSAPPPPDTPQPSSTSPSEKLVPKVKLFNEQTDTPQLSSTSPSTGGATPSPAPKNQPRPKSRRRRFKFNF